MSLGFKRLIYNRQKNSQSFTLSPWLCWSSSSSEWSASSFEPSLSSPASAVAFRLISCLPWAAWRRRFRHWITKHGSSKFYSIKLLLYQQNFSAKLPFLKKGSRLTRDHHAVCTRACMRTFHFNYQNDRCSQNFIWILCHCRQTQCCYKDLTHVLTKLPI